jgi:hypothetical protein
MYDDPPSSIVYIAERLDNGAIKLLGTLVEALGPKTALDIIHANADREEM